MSLRVGLHDSSFLKAASLCSANSLQVSVVCLPLAVGKKIQYHLDDLFHFQKYKSSELSDFVSKNTRRIL